MGALHNGAPQRNPVSRCRNLGSGEHRAGPHVRAGEDFKLSTGFTGRVLVEIKLSTNTKLVAGYTRQLERYREAEEAAAGYYVVLDVGQMGRKHERLIAARNDAVLAGQKVSPIEIIDGTRRESASKL
nr:hypothetical protein [Sphingomonas sp. Y57]